VRGADRVVVRDGDAISALLTRMGAHDAVLAWEERRMRREVRATANRLANFDDANLRRSARAAVAASARVERALEILDGDAPSTCSSPAGCGWSTVRRRWRSSASAPTRR
jgi:DNA-binding protein WhiA